MDDNHLNLIFGAIFLMLIINTTMMFTFMTTFTAKTAGSPEIPVVAAPISPAALSDAAYDPVVAVEATAAPTPAPAEAAMTPAAAAAAPPAVLAAAPAEVPVIAAGPIENPVANPVYGTGAVQPAPTAVALFGTPAYVTVGLPESPDQERREMLAAAIPRFSREGYVRLFTLEQQNLSQALPHVFFYLVNPPLVIDYDVKPTNITDLKYVDYKMGTTEHSETLTIVRPYEQTWARITARNQDSGQIVAQDGYGKDFGLQSPRQIVIRQGGHYEFEIAGEFATINLTMEAKPDGNVR